jgi:putative SOS response-associated peptidase YedK
VCGRYTHLFTWKQLRRLMRLTTFPVEALPLRYNVAPTQTVPVVRAAESGREGALLRWGLIPSWADDPAIGNRLINARAETAHEKPAFRQAFKRRRCLVPASGFYEWAKAGSGGGKPRGGRKQPFYFYPADGELFAFAGLWERWRPRDGSADDSEPVETFTILTTDANTAVRPVHDRMPVILAPDAWDLWLDGKDPEGLPGLLKPCDPALIASHPVSTAVNIPAHDRPDCVEPVR